MKKRLLALAAVAALVAGTRRVARDQLDTEIHVGTRGELGLLAASFNEMTQRLAEAIAAGYDNSLRWSEHTWGLANQHFVPGLHGEAFDTAYAGGLPPNMPGLPNLPKGLPPVVDAHVHLFPDGVFGSASTSSTASGRL